ncbi:MAG TPA: putative toxin-antitoxin system toxin component, PIN family [Opitutae bacterium]|nr:putative toxin-antitoxin system toxin component, PIN family [Opitutae bacterium]
MIIIDTNIYVSYILYRSSSLSKNVAQAMQSHPYAFSVETMRELTEVVMRSKFDRYLSRQIRHRILKGIAFDAEWFTPSETICKCRDSKDDIFLELAVAAKADFFITGDEDLLVLDPFRKTRILTMADFIQTIN